ncbi:hypothetical protein VTN00DRAFT_8184 [Thermoascus crustaceus]|uniref:uncharacterized protein n=1 Tax=Thermoascus crustaceus TaxID=5088 RepID=UPI0037427C65
MRLLTLLLLAATAIAVPELGKRQNQSGFNWTSFTAEIASYAKNPPSTGGVPSDLFPTKTANFGNLQPPPSSLVPIIITAVPPTVLLDLVNPAARSSLANEFKAGNTPGWYQSLPPDVKSYFSVVKSQISEGALTATTGLAFQTTRPTVTGTGTDGAAGTAAAASSSGMAAPVRPTGAGLLAANVAGALGVVGLALAL